MGKDRKLRLTISVAGQFQCIDAHSFKKTNDKCKNCHTHTHTHTHTHKTKTKQTTTKPNSLLLFFSIPFTTEYSTVEYSTVQSLLLVLVVDAEGTGPQLHC